MTTNLQAAILTNNEGVGHLRSNNPIAAIEAFRGAMTKMKRAIEDEEGGPGMIPRCLKEDTNPVLPTCNRKGIFSDKMDGLQTEVLYIFSRPIQVDMNVLADDCLECFDDVVQVISGCIIFNLALVHHQLGVGTGNRHHLVHASGLYNLQLSVLSTTVPNGKIQAMMCIAWNNLAHLHYCQFDFHGSQASMDSAVGLAVESDRLHEFLDDLEVTELHLNVFLLQTPSVAPGA